MPKIFTSSLPSLGPSPACPSSSFPSRFVIGRSRGEAVAERRREELNGYIWHLIHAAPEVAEVSEWLGAGGVRGGEAIGVWRMTSECLTLLRVSSKSVVDQASGLGFVFISSAY